MVDALAWYKWRYMFGALVDVWADIVETFVMMLDG
jgi:hypothetical protein